MLNLVNYFFLAIVIFFLIIELINRKKIKVDNFKISDSVYKILIIIIIIIGLIVRLWQFSLIPGGFNQDGAMAAVDGLALAKYGTDRFGTYLPSHLYAWGYSQMSPLLSYMIAILIKFFDLTPLVARLPQLLVSIMGGIFFYLFIRDIFGKKASLVAAFFVAINPWHFMQSRWALDCNLLPHFFMGGLYFLNLGLLKKKKYIYISMIFFALCMYCYGITIYTLPIFLLATAIYYYIKKKITIKNILISVGIYLLISWPFILTMMVNYFKWNTIKLPFVTIQYFSNSVRANDIIFFSNNFFKQLIENIKCLMNTTILQKKDLVWNDILGFGTMYYFTMPFLILGIFEIVKTKTKGNKGLVFLAVITGILAGLFTNYVNINRVNIIYYGIMMLIVMGIYKVLKEIKYTKFIIPIIYIIAFSMLINTYFTTYKKEIDSAFYKGFGEALKKVEEASTDKIYVTSDVQVKGYIPTSEILTLFYDKMDAHYFQGKSNINNGVEYLPYSERFHYQSITKELVDNTKDDNVSYVIMNYDKQYFDSNYEIIDYGNYSAVIKK